MFSFTKDIGMDLGTASVLIYIKDKGIVLNEPSVVALDKNTGKLLKVGADAQAMLGRTPGNIIAIRPLREGVISDYEVTERMIKEFLHKVMGFQLFKPRIIICVPSGITEVEERAVIDAGIQAGARRVYLIEEPVAAAIGAGIDITQPEGHMIMTSAAVRPISRSFRSPASSNRPPSRSRATSSTRPLSSICAASTTCSSASARPSR